MEGLELILMKWIRAHRGIIMLCAAIITRVFDMVNIRYQTSGHVQMAAYFRSSWIWFVLPVIMFFFIKNDDCRNRRNRMILAAAYSAVYLITEIVRFVRELTYGYVALNVLIWSIPTCVLLLLFARREKDSGDKWFVVSCIVVAGISVAAYLYRPYFGLLVDWVTWLFTFCIAFLNGEVSKPSNGAMKKQATEYSYLEEYKKNQIKGGK